MGKINSMSGFEETLNNKSVSSIIEEISKEIFAVLKSGKFNSPYTKPYTNYRRLTNHHNNLVTKNNIASVSKEMRLGSFINSTQQKLTKIYNAKHSINEEVIVAFIEGLGKFKNQGGEIVFTGGFDMDLMDIVSGNITELKIEDGKVKVSFLLDDGTPRTDEVDLKDAFCPDFSFHCK